jgi:hypothetical protein
VRDHRYAQLCGVSGYAEPAGKVAIAAAILPG